MPRDTSDETPAAVCGGGKAGGGASAARRECAGDPDTLDVHSMA